MAITTLDGLIAALTASTAQQRRQMGLPGLAGNRRWNDTANITGASMAWGRLATPAIGSQALCDHTTAGAIPLTNPGGGAQQYLVHLSGYNGDGGILMLYDRLWHASINTNLNTSQTITGSAMTRPDANGTDTELWLASDPSTTPGAFSANTITITYTNQDGTGSRSAPVGSSNANGGLPSAFFTGGAANMWPVGLAAGDYGVRSVQSAQITTAFGVGKAVLMLIRQIGVLPISNGFSSGFQDMFDLAMSKIDSGACLCVAAMAASAATLPLTLQIGIAEG